MTLPSGRHYVGRAGGKENRCPTCSARLQYGDPNPGAIWFQRLSLTDDQISRLLEAAAEFDDYASQHEDRPTAVEFVDWVRPDVRPKPVNLDYDGIRVHNSVERHPDPLPQAGRRRL